MIGVMSIGLSLSAQNDSPTTKLTLSLSQAQQYAREHNATMKNASLDVRKAEAARWESIASLLPTVKAAFDYSNMCGYKMDMGMFQIAMNPNGTFGLTTAVAYTGAQFVGLKMSKIAMEMSDINCQQTEQNINSQVKNIYTSILVMERTVSLLDSNLKNMESLEQSTLSAVRVGAAEQTDADKLSIQVASLRNSINGVRRSLQLLYNSLILQLGADVDSQLSLTTPLKELLSIDYASALLNQGFDPERNYNYQLLQKSEELAKQQVNMAWMNYTPTVSIYHQYSSKTYFGKDAGMNMTPPNMIGASISLPLFQSGARMAKVKEAQIDFEENANTRKQAEDGLHVQYNQLCYNLVSALDDYRIQDANLSVTRRVFDNISEKYKYGRASSLELTNSSTELISAQSNYIQAIMSVIEAQVALEDLLNNK